MTRITITDGRECQGNPQWPACRVADHAIRLWNADGCASQAVSLRGKWAAVVRRTKAGWSITIQDDRP